jgi:protocatechuate 3,4-dioxygenase beta subunit
MDNEGTVFLNVDIKLQKPDGTVVMITATDSNGFYKFSEVEPGTYFVKETNLSTYPVDISDYDNSNDVDSTDSDTVVDNRIGVTLKAGDGDTENNFADSTNCAVTGTVKDDFGKPIAVITIQLQYSAGSRCCHDND